MCRPNWLSLSFLFCLIAVAGCSGCSGNTPGNSSGNNSGNGNPPPPTGVVVDEARLAGRDAASLAGADEDYYHDMDSGVKLTRDQAVGRNNWVVWTAGNDRLWDVLTDKSAGSFDLLKTISSYSYQDPKLPKFGRHNRWKWLGLVNEPCFEEAKGPDPERFGLWLDKRRSGPDCPPDPFENDKKYPGVALGARGKTEGLPVGSYYGWGTGIVGLRLFPNPAFDEKAKAAWNAEKFYTDPKYYQRKGLIRPYRVGMSCGFCHVGPNPEHPPADPENPQWADLSSNVGAQYFWIDRIFTWDADESSFPYQLFHTSRPGALDTSLVSTDYINNPRTMNAVYSLGARLTQGRRWGKEELVGGERDNKQFNDYGILKDYYEPPGTVWTPRVLKDGADSVGALGALNRVYINIGLFSEEWLRHFNALTGGKPISPIEVKVGRANSSYWQANEAQTPHTAEFFLATTAPHLLKAAPGGGDYLTKDTAKLTRGKEVFAERCARCHSSKLPAQAAGLDPNGCVGPGYLDCWNKYWASTKTDEFKKQMREIVLKDDFLNNNYLSTEARVPVTLLETNACSPLATNAIAGNIWDNYSSHSYKSLPAVGTITVYDPFTGAPKQYTMPAGGRGYTRPASLISLWSTAPYLLNNTVGLFNGDPSVKGRMAAFEDGIQKMLWPEKREKDPKLGGTIPGPSLIDRTTASSYLRVPSGYVPEFLKKQRFLAERLTPAILGEGGIEIGPIPKGTPVNLLTNINLRPDNQTVGQRLAHDKKLLGLLVKIKQDLKALPVNATDEQATAVFKNLVGPMLELSKCPDFVVNRGHYFGTDLFKEEPGLSDADKRALIEFLKTF
jgi:hypothetical protein